MTTYVEVNIHSDPEEEEETQLELQCSSQQNLLPSITNLSNPTCLFTSGATSATESYGKAEKRKLMWATLFTVAFMIAEFVGGYLSGSLAIMTDAAHLLSDCISFIIAILSIWISNRPPDGRMSFGYRRVEVLSALLSIFGIWALTAVLVVMSANRLIEGHYEIDADTMIIVAVLGVVMNVATAFILHGSCSVVHHGHSHGGLGHSYGGGHSHHSHSSPARPRAKAQQLTVAGLPLSRSCSPIPKRIPRTYSCDEKKCDKMEQLIIQNYPPSPQTTSPRSSRHNSFALTSDSSQPNLDTILSSARLKLNKEHLRHRMSFDANINSPDLICSSKVGYSRISLDPGSSRGHSDEEAGHSDTERSSSAGEHHHQCSDSSAEEDSSNLNVRAAIIHVIGDFIQSIGVLIAAVVIKLAPNLKVFDPICTFVFSVIVLVTTVRIFRDSMRILVDAVPSDVTLEKLSEELAFIEGVKTVHDLKVWSVSTGWNVMTVHLMIDPLANPSDILAAANHIARKDFHIKHSTVQIEKMHF
ncbi:proton-coupled zinc antiporter SLC30A2-like [Anopheles bellator]|uniref:proton-coupled zinc antiporter SLC30A2-like n=1 Tax=Anopheles bellator TaxID=139047 RepID=UPI0026475864|nr:proton-coupled zinc antiporter SLC30A2-like [Anopheles bellator]